MMYEKGWEFLIVIVKMHGCILYSQTKNIYTIFSKYDHEQLYLSFIFVWRRNQGVPPGLRSGSGPGSRPLEDGEPGEGPDAIAGCVLEELRSQLLPVSRRASDFATLQSLSCSMDRQPPARPSHGQTPGSNMDI